MAEWGGFVARRKALVELHWIVIVAKNDATKVYEHLLEVGKEHGLIPAGSLTYNTLRIRAGRPAGRELSQDYIPLEVGLWDEVSFAKGCYTGQEIIARMESRGKLAKTIVHLEMSEFIEAPAAIYYDGKLVGTLTSSVVSPHSEIFAIGVIRTNSIQSDYTLTVGEAHIEAHVRQLIGAQPDYLLLE